MHTSVPQKRPRIPALILIIISILGNAFWMAVSRFTIFACMGMTVFFFFIPLTDNEIPTCKPVLRMLLVVGITIAVLTILQITSIIMWNKKTNDRLVLGLLAASLICFILIARILL